MNWIIIIISSSSSSSSNSSSSSIVIIVFCHLDYSYGNDLKYLKLHTLSTWGRYLDVLFLADNYNGSKYFPTLFDTAGLRVPNRNFRDFSLFNVDFKRRNCPSARCSLATNAIDSDADIFNGSSVWANMIYHIIS